MDIELQELPVSQSSVDLENQRSPPRRRVFWSAWVGRVVRNARSEVDTSDSISVRSRASSYLVNVSLRSFSILSGRLSSSRISLATTLLESTQVTDPQRDLLHTITGKSLDDQYYTLILACTWYTAYLDSKIRAAWKPLFRPILGPAGDIFLSDIPAEKDMVKAYNLLDVILVVLQNGAVALTDIVDLLYNKDLIHDESADEQNDDNEERCKAFQLVFASLGIISIFFSPQLNPEPKYLQIEGLGQGDITIVRELGGGSTRYRSKTFTSYSQSIENGKDEPLYRLLHRFGKLIPKYTSRNMSGSGTPHDIYSPRSESIDQSLVCFHTLYKVADVNIEWVDSLCLHLEFNRHEKLLKVFRFPSLCLIMLSTKEKHILESLFRDTRYPNGANGANSARAYFKEILLSYRLIFGQTDGSFKTFKQLYEQEPKSSESWRCIHSVEELADPLLPILCGEDWESEDASQIYNGIEAEDPTSSYDAAINFPYLEDRLIKIQNYVRDHNPHTLRAIWNDRRSIPNWWTFWAVIILGGGALFFSIVQALLQGVSIGIQIWGV